AQIAREQNGHPAGHVALVGAIAGRNSALARVATVRHFLHSTSGTYSNETAAALVAAFPESVVPDYVVLPQTAAGAGRNWTLLFSGRVSYDAGETCRVCRCRA